MICPSIFNDVIGPVMRGPSSSHCAGALRIGRLVRELMGEGGFSDVLVEFDRDGSLATTHVSQGSDMGLAGGLLGWDTADPRMVDSEKTLRERGIKIAYLIGSYDMDHPNTYQITLTSLVEKHVVRAISSGGGMVEIISIDGTDISIIGDYFETLVFTESSGISDRLFSLFNNPDFINTLQTATGACVQIKTETVPADDIIRAIGDMADVFMVRQISPVLPVRSRKELFVPFASCAQMVDYNRDKGLALSALAVCYESNRGNLEKKDIVGQMEEIVDIVIQSVKSGLQGTEEDGRILGYQSGKFAEAMASGSLLGSDVLNTMTLYISSLMEVKSSMGLIVAAPTAGSCACLPGAVLGAVDSLGLSKDDAVRGMLAAGMIGIFIATDSTFAAEVCGCQAECGAASGMAAAALAEMGGGSVDQSLAAASMALQNILGMVCDPVANRVEVPCLTKNAMAAANALTCANMALAGYDPVIPLDEVIKTMDTVGKSIVPELRCTARGGLSITPSARKIEEQLQSMQNKSEK
ncbi:MAG: L-serine ammonia-lyase, iron-sulfur-dependent, subunit alpha [Deltaproteobacteria bacterium]|nr:L-serine ammonia-lyase, iron-sulfur-dependent, subunit alpha [Deltaproteobacteria bacterium]MBW2659004.1 L-serine ammonia-lyase, iron-sulfur-dependent, subunit alpha [Deltaproteobacteria bacterium]